MKILIEIPETERALLLDAEYAGAVAKMLSAATVVRSKGYGSDKRWLPVDEATLTFVLCDEKRFDFQPLTAREKTFEKERDELSGQYWKAISEKTSAEKRAKELEEQLALIKSVTKCETVIPSAPVRADDDLLPL